MTDLKTDAPGFLLENTAKRMKQYFQQQLQEAEAGITVDQWVVLQVLSAHRGISQFEIAQATQKDPPTITRIIDLLCRKQLTKRVTAPDDRRKFIVQLTALGEQKIADTWPVIEKSRQHAWRGISEKDIDQLKQLLMGIHNNLSTTDNP
ncbi:MAG TPA: MarR family winged helix-turn-helix transcriptional regulator [Saprospiraceae bacterium]|nr:MarR family winged helix-turn-helix transcriptional regulator [Saprospiraceae bacterium]